MLVETIRQDLNQAVKNRDPEKMGALRLILAALEYRRLQSRQAVASTGLSQDEEMAVLRSEAKKRQEAIEIYKKANQSERAAQEESELEVINSYLPKQLSEEEVREATKAVIAGLGEGVNPPIRRVNKGQVIGMVIGKLGKEKVDGSVVAKVVSELI